MNKIALITGANKGIGREICNQLAVQGITVIVGARDEAKGEAAAAELRAAGHEAHAVKLDVTNTADVTAAAQWLAEKFGRLDILVNNAGIFQDWGTPPSKLSLEMLQNTLDANFYGPVRLTQALLPLLNDSEAGRIVNISSSLGSLQAMTALDSGYYNTVALAYQSSKAALNVFTVTLAKELQGTNVKVNSACPGWVKTDMGGPMAMMTVEQGADTPVWLATLPDDGPTGGFFLERQPRSW